MENGSQILSIGRNYTIGAMWVQGKEIYLWQMCPKCLLRGDIIEL